MICNKCGETFDEAREIVEYEEAWGRPTVIAEYGVCPFCGSESIEESEVCEHCEREVASSECFGGICRECENLEEKSA
jgi:hypothetical protein